MIPKSVSGFRIGSCEKSKDIDRASVSIETDRALGPDGSVLRHEAGAAGRLQLVAERHGVFPRRRADAQAPDGAAADLSLANDRLSTAELRRVLALQRREGLARFLLAARGGK